MIGDLCVARLKNETARSQTQMECPNVFEPSTELASAEPIELTTQLGHTWTRHVPRRARLSQAEGHAWKSRKLIHNWGIPEIVSCRARRLQQEPPPAGLGAVDGAVARKGF